MGSTGNGACKGAKNNIPPIIHVSMLSSVLKLSEKALCSSKQLYIASSKLLSTSLCKRTINFPAIVSKPITEFKEIPTKMSEFIFPNNQPIVTLDCEKAFSALTEKEKLYAHHLSRAAWYGGLVVLAQTSSESPLIYVLLKKLYQAESISDLKEKAFAECQFTEDDFTAFLVYTSGVLSNMGNYKDFGDKKFIPNLPKEKFVKLVLASKVATSQPKEIQRLLNNCVEKIFSLYDSEKQLGFPEIGVTTYFSKNFTKEDSEIVNKFMKKCNFEAWNTRVFKTQDETGNSSYEIRLASVAATEDPEKNDLLSSHTINGHKFSITRGDYSKLLTLVNKSLEEAKKYAANEKEVGMIDGYIHSFRTGSLDAHKNGSRHWVKNKSPLIETYIGFIETYRDPAGIRGEFEAFVAMVNKPMSVKFEELVNQAENFLPLLPWPNTYEKDKFHKPDFTSLDVLTFAGSGIPAGICIPNYEEIKQDEGFKNVSLGNVIVGEYKSKKINYLSAADEELLKKLSVSTFELAVGLHELLGHGSGKLFIKAKDGSFNFDHSKVLDLETNTQVQSWYEDGDTYDSVFGSLSSPYEECRAECVAVYLSTVPEILKVFGYEGAEAEDIMYVNWLSYCHTSMERLQTYEPKTQSWLQAHSQAGYCILRVLLEAGNDFVKIEEVVGKDGKPDLLLTLDRSKILTVGKPAMGKFLQKLQLYRSTANIEKARTMFNNYSLVPADGPHPFLKYRDIILARKKPRKMFVQSNTSIKDNKVVLKTYEADHEGMIQSWVDRFGNDELDMILEDLWEKDRRHFE